MKKKGFTLVELLATIVILSVIALIATPIVLNVIESSKKSALVSSVKGLVESADVYYTNQILKGDITEDTIFDFEKGEQTSETKLSYKGKVYNGKLILTSDSEVVTCIDDGKYYAYKEIDSDKVISGIGTCVYDGTTGDFDIMTDGDAELIQKQCDIDKEKLQEKIDKLQNEIALKEAAIEELQGSSSAKDSEILVLQGEKEELEKSLKELTDKIASVTATASDVLSGKTIITSSGIVTGTIPSLAAKTYTPGTSNQTIASGKYLSGVQTIKGDSNLVSANIKKGTSIFGVTGTYTSDATATTSQILSGKTAYVNGSKLTGTMANKAGSTVNATTITESGDNALITIPANGYYSTTSKISVPIETIKNEVVGVKTGSTSISTSGTTKITLGFRPTHLSVSQIVNGTMKTLNYYNNTVSDKCVRYDVEGNASVSYDIPSTAPNRIGSIDDEGFIFNASSYANTIIEYTAYK